MNASDFSKRINELENLSSTDQKIAQYFVENFESLPFSTIEKVAIATNSGKGSISRFVSKLGYKGFIDFKTDISTTIQNHLLKLPVETINELQNPNSKKLSNFTANVICNLQKSLDTLTDKDFDKAVDLLTNAKGNIYILGSASAESLSTFFYTLSKYSLNNIHLVPNNRSMLPHFLIDVKPEDTLFTICYFAFANHTVDVTNWFQKKGCKTLVLTNSLDMPFKKPNATLLVSSKSDSVFENRSSAFVVLEALINAIAEKQQNKARFKEMSKISQEFNVLSKNKK